MMLYLGLLAAFILEYVRPGTYIPIINAIKLNTVVPLLVFALTLYAQRPATNQDILWHRNGRWLALFLALLGVSVLHADVTLYSYDAFKAVLGYVFLFFLLGKLLDDRAKLKGFFITLALSHVVLVALNPNLVLHPEIRSYIEGVTFLGDGNDFALSVTLLIPLCLYVLIDSNSKLAKIGVLAILATLVLSVIGTSSRGASIAVAGVVLYLWWRGRAKMMGLVAIGALLIAVIAYAPPEYFERLESIKSYEEEGSAQGRILAWQSAMRMAADHPLLGVGSGHFPVKLGTEYRPPEFGDRNLPWLTAHSIYFLILGELGYPGIIFLLGLIFSSFRAGERNIKRLRQSEVPLARSYERLFLCLNGSLVGFAIGGAFLSALYYPHLFVIAGLFVAAELMYRRDEARLFGQVGVAESVNDATQPA